MYITNMLVGSYLPMVMANTRFHHSKPSNDVLEVAG